MWNIQFIVFAGLTMVYMPAFAYIDPGSGSAIVSLVIGLFVAMGLVVKTYWYKLKALFTKQTGSGNKAEQEPKQSEED